MSLSMQVIDKLIEAFAAQPRIRAGSLIITVYGDAIAPRGGSVWLGSMISMLDQLQIKQRLVRTSVFRLVGEDWLVARQLGRRSYYALTESGRREFETAYRRIYTAPKDNWQDQWTVLLASGMDSKARDALFRKLRWQGFGSLAPDIVLHPQPDGEVLQALLDAHDPDEKIIRLQASTGELPGARTPQRLLETGWDLSELGRSYEAFLERYRPVYAALRRRAPDPRRAFLVRTLLIHEYRRLLLRDPRLPASLLAANWPGLAAYTLCANVYRIVLEPSETWLSENMETAEGPLPAPSRYLFERFEGAAIP